MFNKLVKGWKRYTGFIEPSIPNPDKSDVYLVSYPKSGNTWMRYLLAYAIWPEIDNPDLKEMARLIPSYDLDIDKKAMLDMNSPCNKLENRIIKEHFPYNKIARKYANRVIYLCRDGRDAVISYWHFINQVRGTNIKFNDFIRESATHSFGPWHDHVQQWLDAPVNKVIIRYEDMQSDPSECLKKALDFLNIERDEGVIRSAVERSTFDSMQRLEKNKGFNLDMLRNVEFVRKGMSGTWKDLFDNKTMEIFKEYHGPGISSLNYIW